MKDLSHAVTLFQMEAHRFFQSKKQIIMTFLLGPIMVMLMLFALSSISEGEAQVRICGAEAYAEVLIDNYKENENIVFESTIADYEGQVAAGKNVVVIAVDSDEVRIYYDSSLLTNPDVFYLAQEIADRIVALQINEAQYQAYDEMVSNICLTDMCTPKDVIIEGLIPLVSMVFIIALMFANMSISNLALDAIAGERERGTFDMLRLSGTKIRTIIISKYGFVVIAGVFVLVMEAVFLILGLYQFEPELYQMAAAKAIENPAWFVPVFACLLGISMLVTALYMVLASCFEKVKQASAYASLVQIVLSMFTYAPIVVKKKMLEYLPISNLWAVLQGTLLGENVTNYVIVSEGICMLFAIVALSCATIILERETKR